MRCGSIGAGGSGGESKRQAPGVAPREVVEPPRAEMNQSAYALVGLKSLFKEAPEMLCALSSVEGSNQNCWNGRNIGRCVCVCVCVCVCARARTRARVEGVSSV